MRKRTLLAAAVVLLAVPSLAQNTDIEALSGITFNFANPGARSMGMGGAFLGLADDASAAEANPAGLTILRKTEISLEARNYRNSQTVAVSGTFPDLLYEEFSSFSRTAEVQFGSIVIPRGNWAVAVYYHQPINYNNAAAVLPELDRTGTVITRDVPDFYFPAGNPPGSAGPTSREECLESALCLNGSVLPFVTAVNVKLETFGLAGAVKMGRLSLGASARYHRFEEGAFTTRFFQGTPVNIAVQATSLDEVTSETGKEDDISFGGGFKWTLSDRFSIGGSYKQGPEFESPLYLLDIQEDEPFSKIADTKFHVPDVAGIGFSWRPIPVLTVNVDGVHVTYSNLVDDFRSIGFGTVLLEEPFEAKDVTEIHVGGEYFFATRIPFAIRAGWWRDPTHALRYTGPLTCNEEAYPLERRTECVANRVVQHILFPEGDDEDHYTVGVGLAWPNFQIDAAYDTSDAFKVGSITGVYRF